MSKAFSGVHIPSAALRFDLSAFECPGKPGRCFTPPADFTLTSAVHCRTLSHEKDNSKTTFVFKEHIKEVHGFCSPPNWTPYQKGKAVLSCAFCLHRSYDCITYSPKSRNTHGQKTVWAIRQPNRWELRGGQWGQEDTNLHREGRVEVAGTSR